MGELIQGNFTIHATRFCQEVIGNLKYEDRNAD